MENEPQKEVPAEVRDYMARIGKRGGMRGGRARGRVKRRSRAHYRGLQIILEQRRKSVMNSRGALKYALEMLVMSARSLSHTEIVGMDENNRARVGKQLAKLADLLERKLNRMNARDAAKKEKGSE